MIKNFSPYAIVKEGLEDLKENEKKVVTGRFGVDGNRKTLSAIGRELNLSRERIRQIEKEGLKKLSANIISEHPQTVDQIIKVFEKHGGVALHDKIGEKFLEQAMHGKANEFNSLSLIFFVMPQLKKIKKTKELEEGWILASLSRDEAVRVIDDWVMHLKNVSKPQKLDVLVNAHPHHSKYEVTFLSELPSISKKIVKTEDGVIGLANWSEINPRNIRDKIYYTLKQAGKPMHFEDIASAIKAQGFDRKKVVKATVHNELIADDRFVLVGRGIYALTEWGYREGTVADIITGILKSKKEAMAVDEILKEVLKQRMVKRNTVLINLKTRPEFQRVGDDSYALQKTV